MSITSDWVSGYCAKIVVTNHTSQTLDWKATLDNIQGTINTMWGASYAQSGSQVNIEGVRWTNVLPANLSSNDPSLNWDIGFCANR